MERVTLAVVGDVHRAWGAEDNAAFAASDVDGVLFVGDLPDALHGGLLDTARALSGVGRPAVMVPGNHDGPRLMAVWREATPLGGAGWMGRLADDFPARMATLAAALHPVALGGYSLHGFGAATVVVGRPHAMDGRRLCFARRLAAYGVESLATSAAKLRSLVDEAASGPLVFLAHNGPRGVGGGRDAPWHLGPLDLGDPDLADAVGHARATRSGPIAVVAGHFHRGRRRRGIVEQDGVLYVNAAEVPRIRDGRRHHVRLQCDGDRWHAEDRWSTS